ncbi:uncharacterized protein F5891DRAFT_985968 [Suillus fuscotomentosus]|uniref:Uncharacterized protein n=1 Tax=Suillus fuscotomentosus TaxID=1912939 RepID=A0AAD4DST7_9AGAM|nr:uncharacterized protein F5891DRAFT_985968 [Suillus fuscotomentosus]KAG1893301.1 hypothetical protein F5891DRAFT_985968 [Suillus fuscotomentosus]
MHKHAYYAHNKSTISAKMKDKYLARVDRDNTNPHKTSSNIMDKTSSDAPKSLRKKLQGPLRKYLGGEPQEVINELLLDYLATGVSDRIRSAIGVVQDIFSELQDAEDDLSQQGKSGIGYTSACQATKDAKDVLLALEDVLSFILVNGIKLEELYVPDANRPKLYYAVQPKPSMKKKVVQTIAGFMAYLPNITILSTAPNCNIVQPKLSTKKKVVQAIAGFIMLPILTLCTASRSILAHAWDIIIYVQPSSHYTCHIMAPPKWTSDEQEEWLKPYYEAFLVKQSEKCDLYENWFEAFPEPRPTGVTALGPMTLEELNEMKLAEDARKVKLHNRFKNNFGATKAGRKAKAHATNIINAVVRKITECEKLTRRLQEQGAYSKLYYCDCIKPIVQEKLAAVKEERKLTNGEWVALVKKETAALYVNETPEVKARVKEYLEEQKQQKVQDKEEGPWSKSEANQSQNLDKLAAVTNKFLKGLADATRMSFSLLAGGPSPEAQGQIDVMAYPGFERGVMGPFRDFLCRVYDKDPGLLMSAQESQDISDGPVSIRDVSPIMAASPTSSKIYLMTGQSSPWDVSAGASLPFEPSSSPSMETSLDFYSSGSATFGGETPYWATPEFDSVLGAMLQTQSKSHGQQEPSVMLPFAPFDSWDTTSFPSTPGMAPDDLLADASPRTTSTTLPDGVLPPISPAALVTQAGPTSPMSTAPAFAPVLLPTSPAALVTQAGSTVPISTAPAVAPVLPPTSPVALVTQAGSTSPISTEPAIAPVLPPTSPTALVTGSTSAAPTIPTTPAVVSSETAPDPTIQPSVMPAVTTTLVKVDSNTAEEQNHEDGRHRTSRKSKPSTRNDVANSIGHLGKENVPPKPSAKCRMAEDASSHSAKSNEQEGEGVIYYSRVSSLLHAVTFYETYLKCWWP